MEIVIIRRSVAVLLFALGSLAVPALAGGDTIHRDGPRTGQIDFAAKHLDPRTEQDIEVTAAGAILCDVTEDPGDIDGGAGADYAPGKTWRSAEPAALGFDASAIRKLQRDVTADVYGAIDGVLLVRHGYLVLEHYAGWSPADPHTLQSVTKSITSLLFGILAHDEPRLDLDQPVLPLFSRYSTIENVDERKRALTLRHLLTMRTSMDFWEQPYAGSPLDQLNRSRGDWVERVLDRPMTGTPGSVWAYNSGAPIVLCGLLRDRTGVSVQTFARQRLFEPLGITGERWHSSPYDGLAHCGGGLSLKPVDLARIGYLVLRHGRWGDRQVVAREWLDESVRAYTRGRDLFFSNDHSGYGYAWWLFPRRRGGADAGIVAASGAGGQWLFVIRELDLVVVVVAEDGDGLDLLYDGVLPAIARRPGSP